MGRNQRQQVQQMPMPQGQVDDAMHMQIMAARQEQADRQLQTIRELQMANQKQNIDLYLALRQLELQQQRAMK